jgi:NAD(P)-dependent dehydrogenase (short-subunit alcohol dehydrogenase family)
MATITPTGVARATALATMDFGARDFDLGDRAGILLSLKHEMRVMLRQRVGSIVNLSSMSGKGRVPGASVYVASKHAVEGFTKSAALGLVPCGVWTPGSIP